MTDRAGCAFSHRCVVALLVAVIGCSSFGAAQESNDGGASQQTEAGPAPSADAGPTPKADTGPAPSADAGQKPCDGVLFNGHYYFCTPAAPQMVAATACMDAGAHLVTIQSQTENDVVVKIMPDDAWIGLVSAGNTLDRAAFVWMTGEPKPVEFWDQDEPDKGERCVVIYPGGAWSDRSCTAQQIGVCERE